jgi:hypothetical protein
MPQDGGLRKLFQTKFSEAHWQSVETSGVGRGVPDSNYCFPVGIEGWVEFKQTGTDNAGLRPEQVGWISRRARRGGRVFVAIRQKHGGGPRKGVPADGLWLFHGAWVEDLHEKGIFGTAINCSCFYEGGPAKWDWDAVRRVLCC